MSGRLVYKCSKIFWTRQQAVWSIWSEEREKETVPSEGGEGEWNGREDRVDGTVIEMGE